MADVTRHAGGAIVLPDGLAVGRAIDILSQYEKEQENLQNVDMPLPGHWHDAAVALSVVLADMFGFVASKPRQSMFGSRPPRVVSIPVSASDSASVAVGEFALPVLTEDEHVGIHPGPRCADGTGAVLVGLVRGKNLGIWEDICRRVAEHMRERSIFRGQAVRFDRDSDGQVSLSFLSGFRSAEDVVLNDSVQAAVDLNILVPVRDRVALSAEGVSFRRGVLLLGGYGTGKSMLGGALARECAASGVSYLYVPDVSELRAAIGFARCYAPALIFCEDLDMAARSREGEGNLLLNALDEVGGQEEILTVLTSNDVSCVDRAFLRPGRIDAVITMELPDSDSVGRLLRRRLDGVLSPDEDISRACDMLAGCMPAAVAEVARRARISAFSRCDGGVCAADVERAAVSMQAHLSLLSEAPDGAAASGSEVLAREIAAHVSEGVAGAVSAAVARL